MDEQSVRAIMPIRTFGVSGASAAYTAPTHPRGNPASRRAIPADAVCVSTARRLNVLSSPSGSVERGVPVSSTMRELLLYRVRNAVIQISASYSCGNGARYMPGLCRILEDSMWLYKKRMPDFSGCETAYGMA